MTEEPIYLTELEQRVLEELEAGFPVAASPFRILAEDIGNTEDNVYTVARKLRESGVVSWLGVRPHRPGPQQTSVGEGPDIGVLGELELAVDQLALAEALGDQLPLGMRPYRELAAVLRERGIEDADEEWVLDVLDDWIDEGLVSPPRAER